VYIYTRRGHPKRPDLWGSGVFLGCKIYDGGYTEITRFMYIQLAGDNVYNNGKSRRLLLALFVRLYCYGYNIMVSGGHYKLYNSIAITYITLSFKLLTAITV